MRKLFAIILCFCMAMPVFGAENEEKYVALTFDDGPSGRYTRALLDGLEKRGVKATFLLCGYRMKDYPKETERIFAAGHEIGLHGYSHKCMSDLCPEELEREISDTMALLPAGCRPIFLRPPGGKHSKMVCDIAKRAGLAILQWSVDPKDWCCDDAAAIESAVVESVRSGDVILLHDMSESSVEAALAIVDKLSAKGFRFVTASELAARSGIAIQPGKVYQRFVLS